MDAIWAPETWGMPTWKCSWNKKIALGTPNYRTPYFDLGEVKKIDQEKTDLFSYICSFLLGTISFEKCAGTISVWLGHR